MIKTVKYNSDGTVRPPNRAIERPAITTSEATHQGRVNEANVVPVTDQFLPKPLDYWIEYRFHTGEVDSNTFKFSPWLNARRKAIVPK
jgi:hypothetical protein